MQSKLTKARINSFDLWRTWRPNEAARKAGSTRQADPKISGVNNRINAMNAASPPDILSRELAAIEGEIRAS